MKRASSLSLSILVLIAVLLTACASTAQGGSYHSALKTDYKDALDVEGQLALGTLKLENTNNQVTQDEATTLLPPWEALQANAAKSTVERQALLEQIEQTMSSAQISAIAAMQLTQADAQTWLRSQATGGTTGRGQQGRTSGTSARSGTRAGSTTGQADIFLLRPVITLLAARSGQGGAQPSSATPPVESTRRAAQTRQAPEAVTSTPAPMDTPTQAAPPAAHGAPAAASTPMPTPTPTGLAPTATPDSASLLSPTAVPASALAAPLEAAPASALVAAPADALAIAPADALAQDLPDTPTPAAATAPALTWLPDTDPGPPFTIEISANRATQDPLVQESRTYLVTGLVRNDSDRTYTLDRINVTFYDGNGFRGHFRRFTNRRMGGEWIWFGATEADSPCVLLAPGEACPFSVAITAQDIVSFLVHPDGAPTDRESAPVSLGGLNVTRDPSDYVRITGIATNTNPFAVKNVIVVGVLRDGNGQMVSLGSGYVLQENMESGSAVPFDLRIPYTSYASYQFYAQAERDWQ
jgi:hypothetical protein